jgi:hypothetical protein
MPDGKRKEHYLEPLLIPEFERLQDRGANDGAMHGDRRRAARTHRNLIADADTDVNLDFDLDIVEQPSQDSQADSDGLVRAPSRDYASSSSEEDEPFAPGPRLVPRPGVLQWSRGGYSHQRMGVFQTEDEQESPKSLVPVAAPRRAGRPGTTRLRSEIRRHVRRHAEPI